MIDWMAYYGIRKNGSTVTISEEGVMRALAEFPKLPRYEAFKAYIKMASDMEAISRQMHAATVFSTPAGFALSYYPTRLMVKSDIYD